MTVLDRVTVTLLDGETLVIERPGLNVHFPEVPRGGMRVDPEHAPPIRSAVVTSNGELVTTIDGFREINVEYGWPEE